MESSVLSVYSSDAGADKHELLESCAYTEVDFPILGGAFEGGHEQRED